MSQEVRRSVHYFLDWGMWSSLCLVMLSWLVVGAVQFDDVGDEVDVFALAARADVVVASDEVSDEVDVFALAATLPWSAEDFGLDEVSDEVDVFAPCGKFARVVDAQTEVAF